MVVESTPLLLEHIGLSAARNDHAWLPCKRKTDFQRQTLEYAQPPHISDNHTFVGFAFYNRISTRTVGSMLGVSPVYVRLSDSE